MEYILAHRAEVQAGGEYSKILRSQCRTVLPWGSTVVSAGNSTTVVVHGNAVW